MAHWDSQVPEEDAAIDQTADPSHGRSLEEGEVVVVVEAIVLRVNWLRANRYEDHPISAWEGPAIVVAKAPECADGSCSKAVGYWGSCSLTVGEDGSGRQMVAPFSVRYS